MRFREIRSEQSLPVFPPKTKLSSDFWKDKDLCTYDNFYDAVSDRRPCPYVIANNDIKISIGAIGGDKIGFEISTHPDKKFVADFEYFNIILSYLRDNVAEDEIKNNIAIMIILNGIRVCEK